MILEICLGVSLVMTGILGYLVYNLSNKLSVYEDWVERFRNDVGQLHDRLKAVDEKNLFERDDDVGFVFSEIVRIVNEFNDEIQ